MLLRLAQHAEGTGIIAALTRHKGKQAIQYIVIAFLLGHQPQLVAHQRAVVA